MSFLPAFPVTCPECGTVLDRHDSMTHPGDAPSPGDITVCIKCAAVSEYRQGMGQLVIAAVSPGERQQLLAENPQLLDVVRWITRRDLA